MKIKKLFTVGVCCLALMGCSLSMDKSDRIVDLEPKLENFVNNFNKYFLGKNVSLFKAAFFGTYKYDGISYNLEAATPLAYLNPYGYDLKGIANFYPSEHKLYGCNLEILLGEGNKIIGIRPEFSPKNYNKYSVKNCSLADKVMNHFVATYYDGISEEQVAKNADVLLDDLVRRYNENLHEQREKELLERQRAVEKKRQENSFLLSSKARGAKVCKFFDEGGEFGYVEDSANEKIKINIVHAGPNMNNTAITFGGFTPHVTWDYPDNWSLCE